MFNFWLIKTCILSLLHKGSLKYRFYFENSRSRLNWLRARYSDSSVRMIRLREQKSIFTGLWIHDILVTLQSRLAKIYLPFCKNRQGLLRCPFWFCLGISCPFASDTSRSELTKKAWENAVQRLGNLQMWPFEPADKSLGYISCGVLL